MDKSAVTKCPFEPGSPNQNSHNKQLITISNSSHKITFLLYYFYLSKQSLCKNLERADTKRWLTETLETLMRERLGEEKKEEGKKLEVKST